MCQRPRSTNRYAASSTETYDCDSWIAYSQFRMCAKPSFCVNGAVRCVQDAGFHAPFHAAYPCRFYDEVQRYEGSFGTTLGVLKTIVCFDSASSSAVIPPSCSLRTLIVD